MLYGMIFIFFLGVGITSATSKTIDEVNQKKVKNLLSKSLVDILEGVTERVEERQEILKRNLTELEKDIVFSIMNIEKTIDFRM